MKTADGFSLPLGGKHTYAHTPTHRKIDVTHNEKHICTILTGSSLSEVLSDVITVITAIEGHFLWEWSVIVMSHSSLLHPPPPQHYLSEKDQIVFTLSQKILPSIPPATVSLNSFISYPSIWTHYSPQSLQKNSDPHKLPRTGPRNHGKSAGRGTVNKEWHDE